MKILSAITLLIGLLVRSQSLAATFYVATTGNDSNTCAQAQNPSTPKRNIMGASNGLACLQSDKADRLEIRGGTYNEIISNQSQKYPSATSYTNAATIASYPGETATVFGVGAQGNASYMIFERLHVTGPTTFEVSNLPDTIFLGDTSNHIKFVNMNVEGGANVVQIGPDSSSNWFVGGEYHDNGDLSAGTWKFSPGYAFYNNGSDNIFENLKIYNIRGYGIHNYSGYTQKPSRNIYRNIELSNNCMGSPFFPRGVDSEAAIIVASGDSNEVYNSIVRDGACHGIQVYHATNTKLYNNTITGNAQSAINLINATGSVIKNNILYGNSSAAYLFTSHTGTTFGNNLCGSPGTGCAVVGDPLFADPVSRGLAPLLGSPAIGAGTPYIDANISLPFVPDIGAMLDLIR